jgi:hypothetical protein
MSSWRPPSLSEEELREEREWALADRHADMRHAKVDTPWQCLLLSFHALFGCDHALRWQTEGGETWRVGEKTPLMAG